MGHGEQLRLGTGKAFGDGTASVAVDDPGPKVSGNEVGAWHHEESLWEGIGEA